MKKYILIDSNFLCHRARFSLGSLNNGVIFGFMTDILNLSEIHRTNDFIFVWDSKKSYRKKYFPNYKKKRYLLMTEQERKELNLAFEQMKILRKEILPRLGFRNNLMQTGVEGDDIIAKISELPNMYKNKIIMVTSDKDMLQILDDNLVMWNGKKMYTKDDFIEEWGIQPKQWKKVKSIGGCKSDNIPGVPGVAEKTACKFLRNELKETTKAFQKITSEEGLAIEKFNRILVNLPHPKTKDVTLVEDELDIEEFRKFFEEYNMKLFLRDRFDEFENLVSGNYDSARKRPKSKRRPLKRRR